MELSTGPNTVYVSALLVPLGVVTVMLRGPMAAVFVVLKVARSVVEFRYVTPVINNPFAGATLIVVPVGVKLLPVRVTTIGLGAPERRRP
jgi:hypothetical protein